MTDKPFEMWLAAAHAPFRKEMWTESYEFARSASLRRVACTQGSVDQEAYNQTTCAEVRVRGDVLFRTRRNIEITATGRRMVQVFVDYDWLSPATVFPVKLVERALV